MIRELIANRRLIVTVGPGGVGKTTLSAALALAAAQSGRKTLVLTIDPAKRLAQALGLSGVDDATHRVPIDEGHLDAVMLDTGRSFDALIERVAKSEAQRDEIFANRIYRAFSRTMARSHAYIAMERLYHASTHGQYDLIVLDTPPMRSALDILDAPDHLERFLDERIVRWFVRPGTIATKVLGRLAGGQLLEEIMTFLILFLDLREGFAQRAASTRALLRDSKTAFALVASPGPNHLHDAGNLVRGLAERNVSLDVVVMNQSFIPEPADPMVPVQARPGPRPVPAGYESLVEKLDAIRASAVRDNEAAERGIEEFVSRERLRGAPILRLAKMSEPVHRLTGLDHLAQRLMEAGEGATGAGVGSL